MKTYDPTKIIVTVGPYVIGGFAEGSMVKAERNVDAYKLTVGAKGDAVRFKTADRSGRITLTLLQSSGSNGQLTSLALLDENGNPLQGVAGLLSQIPIIGGVLGAIASAPVEGKAPVLIKDLNGVPLWAAADAWILRAPGAAWDETVKERTWILETDNLSYLEGGY
jgi:hypothetical protein